MTLKQFFSIGLLLFTAQLQSMNEPSLTSILEAEAQQTTSTRTQAAYPTHPAEILIHRSTPQESVLPTIEPRQPRYTFADLINVPAKLNKLVRAINRPNRSERSSNMLLLYGPPGNGKTTYAEALAHATGRVFYHISSSIFGSTYKGAAPEIMRAIFAKINERAQPCIILFDELDGVADKDVGGAHNEFKQAVFALFDHTDLKNPNMFIVLTTNRREAIPHALLSRCGHKLEITNPDEPTRAQLLSRYIRTIFDIDQFPADKAELLAEDTNNFSIRDLDALVTTTFELTDIPETDDQEVKNNAIEAALYDTLFEMRGITSHNRLKAIKYYLQLEQPQAPVLSDDFYEQLAKLTEPYFTKKDYIALIAQARALAATRPNNNQINEQDLLTAYYMTNPYTEIERVPLITEDEDGRRTYTLTLVKLNQLPSLTHRTRILNYYLRNENIAQEAIARFAIRTQNLHGTHFATIIREATRLKRSRNAAHIEEQDLWVAFHNFISKLPVYAGRTSYYSEPVRHPYEKIKISKKLLSPQERLAFLRYHTRHKQTQLSQNFLENFAARLPVTRRKETLSSLAIQAVTIAERQNRVILQDQDFESAAYNLGLLSRWWCTVL